MTKTLAAKAAILFSISSGLAIGLSARQALAQSEAQTPDSPESNLTSSLRKNLFPQSQPENSSGLVLYPEIYAGLAYDDNIYSTRNNTISDTLAVFTPSILVKAGNNKHNLNLTSGIDVARFGSHTTENYTDGWLDLQGKSDTVKGGDITGGFGVDYSHEPRGTQDAFIGQYPTRYRDTHYNLGISQKLGQWTLRVAGTSADKRFDNIENSVGWINSLRDHTETNAGVRLTYSIDRSYGLYVQGIKNERSYRTPLDNYGYDRNSSGYRVVAGLEFKTTRHISGDLYAGRLTQQYIDARFDSINTPTFGANLKWSPAPYYGATAYIRRNLFETTLPGTPGDIYTSGGINVKRWISERTRLRTDFAVAQAHYPQIDRTDSILSAGLGLDYRLAGKTFVEFNYDIVGRNSNVTNLSQQYYADYADSQVSLGIRQIFYRVPTLQTDMTSAFPQTLDGNWGGPYAGLLAGYGATQTQTTGGRGSHGVDNGNMANDGTHGGFFAGYGWTHNRWYYGLEIGAADTSAEWYHQKTKPGGREFSLTQYQSYGATLRLGRALANGSLPFVSIGATRTRFATQYDVLGQPSTDIRNNLTAAAYGVGIDTPLSRHFFARLAYTYSLYPNYDVSYTDGNVVQTETFHNTQSLFLVGIGAHLEKLPTPDIQPRSQGFYTGIAIGNADLSTRLDADQTDAGPVYSQLHADFGKSGFFSGLYLGYGQRIWNRIYAGIEGGFYDTHTGWQHTRTPTGRVFSVDMNASALATLNLGYLLDNGTLLYVSGGIDRARFNSQYKKGGNPNAWIDQDEIKTGSVVGLGCRTPINSSMFLRLAYDYVKFPEYGFTTINNNADTVKFNNKLSIFTLSLGWML